MPNKLRRKSFNHSGLKYPPSLCPHGFPLRHVAKTETVTLRRALLKDCPGWAEKHAQAERAAFEDGYLVDAFLAFLGPRGTGKTQSATLLAWIAEDAGFDTRYSALHEFFSAIKSAYGGGGIEETVLKKYIAPQLLVLDECHERGETAWEDRTLVGLLDLRYRDCKATILIANDTPEKFAASMGPSVMRRINETGGIIQFAAIVPGSGA